MDKTEQLTRSSTGFYRLNQHASVFAHKTTKRLKDRSSIKRVAIQRSSRGE